MVGIEAKTGKFLWIYNKTIDQGANIITPIVAGDRVFSAGPRTGGGLVQLKVERNGVTDDQTLKAKGIRTNALPVASPNLNGRCERVIQSLK